MVEVATDQYGKDLINASPRGVNLARTVSTVNSSTYLALNAQTSFIRVYAISKDCYLKWASSGTDYVNPQNFDEVIPAGQYMDFAIPYAPDGTLFEAIQLVGRESGCTAIVQEK